MCKLLIYKFIYFLKIKYLFKIFFQKDNFTNKMKKISLLLLLIFVLQSAFAQKILRLETPSNLKRIEYYVGSNITFRLHEDPNWYTRTITDMDFGQKMLIFEVGRLPIEDIEAVKIARRGFIAQTSGILQGSGISFAFFGSTGFLINSRCSNCRESVLLGASMWTLGQLLGWISPRRKFKVGTKNQLRMFEIDFTPRSN